MKKEKQYTVIIEKGKDGNLIGTALEIPNDEGILEYTLTVGINA